MDDLRAGLVSAGRAVTEAQQEADEVKRQVAQQEAALAAKYGTTIDVLKRLGEVTCAPAAPPPRPLPAAHGHTRPRPLRPRAAPRSSHPRNFLLPPRHRPPPSLPPTSSHPLPSPNPSPCPLPPQCQVRQARVPARADQGGPRRRQARQGGARLRARPVQEGGGGQGG